MKTTLIFGRVLKGLTLLFCLMSNTIFSQNSDNVSSYDNNSTRRFMFGVKAGPNFTSFANPFSYYESEGIVRFHLGALMNINISDLFSIQTEVVYSQQGATLISQNNYEEKREIDYLNIPIMACFEVIENLTIQGGPQIGFVITLWNEDFDIFDYGANAGVQYNLPINIFFQVNYFIGFNKIGVEGSNRVASISIGYLFD